MPTLAEMNRHYHRNVAATANGPNILIPAQGGRNRTEVMGYHLICSGNPVDVYINDGTDDIAYGTAAAPTTLDASGVTGAVGLSVDVGERPCWRAGAANRPINLNLSAASKKVTGWIVFRRGSG